jgi:colicin import membrane protein
MTFRLPHLIAAVALHVVLLGVIVGGVQCSGKVHRPPVISAVLLDPSRQQVASDKRREEQRRLEERRKAEQERKRREDEARRVEQQRKAQADAAAQKKKEDEARKARLAADQKKAAEQKKAADQKRVAEQKATEQKKAEDAARRQREAQAREETEQRARMAEELEAEETQRAADREAAARSASERDAKLSEWAATLARTIARAYQGPPGAPEDFECVVRLQLLPDGTVTEAKIEKSCGNAQLDRSVEEAVYRASPLPKPADPSVFDRDLTIRFVPES